jgi:hypothetical protein
MRRRSRSRRSRSARPFWGNPETAAGPRQAVRPSEHPTALIESLGVPPFPRADVAPHYFEAVYQRAAAMAVALATAAGVVDAVEGEGTDEPGSHGAASPPDGPAA